MSVRALRFFNDLESRFSVLKQFILEYKTVEAMHEELRKNTEKNIFSSGLEKEPHEY